MTDTDVPTGPGDGDGDGDSAVGSPPRWWAWAAAAALVLVVAVTIWAIQDDDEPEEPTPSSTTTTTTTTTTEPTTTTTRTTTPTTTPSPALTLEALSDQMATVAPASISAPPWQCRASTAGPLAAGSIATCIPSPPPTDGEIPNVTVLVLDNAGTYAAAHSGNDHLLLNPGERDRPFPSEPPVPPGLNCTNLLAPDSAFTQLAQADQLTAEQTYFAVVLYYFTHGRSPLMDIDDNGIPCETLIDPSVVDTVWAGGWIACRNPGSPGSC